MGVSGSGKSTIGGLLAERLGGDFLDADDFHPPDNLRKMKAGKPLTDQDRWPWLERIAHAMVEYRGNGPLVVACSALKEAYRRRLGRNRFHLVYLKGTREETARRHGSRRNHFMPSRLLVSQFADLEEPSDGLTVSIAGTPEEIVAHIVRELGKTPAAPAPHHPPKMRFRD